MAKWKSTLWILNELFRIRIITMCGRIYCIVVKEMRLSCFVYRACGNIWLRICFLIIIPYNLFQVLIKNSTHYAISIFANEKFFIKVFSSLLIEIYESKSNNWKNLRHATDEIKFIIIREELDMTWAETFSILRKNSSSSSLLSSSWLPLETIWHLC